MLLNWINPEDYSFYCHLMMERFQIRLLLSYKFPEWQNNLGVALRHNPAVLWYFTHKCPECADVAKRISADAPERLSCEEIRKAEIFVMACEQDFVIYTTPELMDTHCGFIYNWDKEHLYELANFTDKIVLDVGSGSGRLALAAAEKAKRVYASEPVDNLREYLRDKIVRERINNIRVVDGMADSLPFEDNTFDIVMSGHVVGDDFDKEIAELTRVAKNGGWVIDCQGDRLDLDDKPNLRAEAMGYERFTYISSGGGITYNYRKQIFK